MKTIRFGVALWIGLGAGPAFGQESATEEDGYEGITTGGLPAMSDMPGDASFMGPVLVPADALVSAGAAALELEEDYVRGTRDGFAMVFRREYKQARKHFVALDQRYPGTGISGSVDALVWQALMLENFDFRYDKQYQVANKKAVADLKTALQEPKHQAWEHFQLAGLMGVEAIHQIRQGTFLPALSRAFEAMDHVQAAGEASPDFVDLQIAEGMYNYWRTVVTKSSSMLPDFGDHRAEGISQIQTVEREGFFLQAPATLALAFSWLEERQYAKAESAAMRNRALYPNNVINNLLLGQSQLYQRKYDAARSSFQDVLKASPQNNRAVYYLGLTDLRQRRLGDAAAQFEKYLAADHLEDWQRASALYRLGQVRYRQKRYSDAAEHYAAAVKTNGHKPSKAALNQMKARRKQGKIDF